MDLSKLAFQRSAWAKSAPLEVGTGEVGEAVVAPPRRVPWSLAPLKSRCFFGGAGEIGPERSVPTSLAAHQDAAEGKQFRTEPPERSMPSIRMSQVGRPAEVRPQAQVSIRLAPKR